MENQSILWKLRILELPMKCIAYMIAVADEEHNKINRIERRQKAETTFRLERSQ